MTFCFSFEVLIKLNPIRSEYQRRSAFIIIIKEAGQKSVNNYFIHASHTSCFNLHFIPYTLDVMHFIYTNS